MLQQSKTWYSSLPIGCIRSVLGPVRVHGTSVNLYCIGLYSSLIGILLYIKIMKNSIDFSV